MTPEPSGTGSEQGGTLGAHSAIDPGGGGPRSVTGFLVIRQKANALMVRSAWAGLSLSNTPALALCNARWRSVTLPEQQNGMRAGL